MFSRTKVFKRDKLNLTVRVTITTTLVGDFMYIDYLYEMAVTHDEFTGALLATTTETLIERI
jgi:hypothetical protein